MHTGMSQKITNVNDTNALGTQQREEFSKTKRKKSKCPLGTQQTEEFSKTKRKKSKCPLGTQQTEEFSKTKTKKKEE